MHGNYIKFNYILYKIMMYCIECGNEAIVCYGGFKLVTKENYHRVIEDNNWRCYCKIHLPRVQTSLKSMHEFSKVRELPDEFIQWIESDLNKVTEVLPDYLQEKYDEIIKNRNYEHVFEFLIGWCIGTCESSYFQAYQHEYGKIPSEIQITEIRKIISRRRIQIEQGISAFLNENEE